MKEIAFKDLQEKGVYIVESKENIRRKGAKAMIRSEFESNFEFEYSQIITILKIELPYFVIKARHGREFVKLSENYHYLEPSEDFIKKLNWNCQCEY